jgi:haloalkane dehalogenase
VFRTPGVGWLMISGFNLFVRQILPKATVRRLGTAEMARYAEPFPTPASRRPVRQWPREIPIEGRPADVHEVVEAYRRWLEETRLPKLLLYARPGGLLPYSRAAQLAAKLPELTAVDIGTGIHYVQEDNPHEIGHQIADWYRGLGGGEGNTGT